MKQLTPIEEKQIIQLENKWLKHKRLRGKTDCASHKDFLTPIQREEILDKLFTIFFND